MIEIPDLRHMKAEGEVEEADSGRVAPGQTVSLRLDAHPETVFKGRVAALRGAVQTRSAMSPQKIVHVNVDLARTDPMRMRPGMRFVGTIEVERVKGVVVAPADAVFSGPDGPVAYRRGRWGLDAVHPRLGRHTATTVEVIAGLAPGDVLARNPPGRGSGDGSEGGPARGAIGGSAGGGAGAGPAAARGGGR